jgi:hypothetical protein
MEAAKGPGGAPSSQRPGARGEGEGASQPPPPLAGGGGPPREGGPADPQPPPRVRSHCCFRKRGAECVSESGMEWMSGSTKRQCDRALPPPPPSEGSVRERLAGGSSRPGGSLGLSSLWSASGRPPPARARGSAHGGGSRQCGGQADRRRSSSRPAAPCPSRGPCPAAATPKV